MKVKYYETKFKCTETLQNGSERQITKSVFSPIFKDGRHVVQIARIDKAIEALKAEHYYDIEYIGTSTKTVIFAE